MTLKPLMHPLGLVGTDDTLRTELSERRSQILGAGIQAAAREPEHIANALKAKLSAAVEMSDSDDPQGRTAYDEAVARVVAAERAMLYDMRAHGQVADDVFYLLEEELDWSELATRPAGAIGDPDG